MTNQQGQEQPSVFNTRADSAALKLKGDLSQQLSAMTGQPVELPHTPVAVGNDGKPVGQLPPEGSYARDQIDQQREVAAQREQQQAYLQAHDPGSQQQTQEAPVQQPPQEPQEQVSQRTQERISSLVSQLRAKDQEAQALQQQQANSATTVEELQSQLVASRNQMESLVTEHMDQMDPETRNQVLNSARIREAVAESENRILQTLSPQLNALQQRNEQLEKVSLSSTYTGYNPMVHDELIDEFRRANKNCSVEQAFRAVATPEELSVSGGGHVNVVPPSVPPGNGAIEPRYMPQQTNQQDPVEQMREDARRAAELARSGDPKDQKAATALWHQNLADRLGMTIPGQ